MSFLSSVILGIIEGISEFLPISSTGHLILTAHLLKLERTTFLKSFEISITFKQSFLIGIFQSLAIVPGVSRAAATIIGGLQFRLWALRWHWI